MKHFQCLLSLSLLITMLVACADTSMLDSKATSPMRSSNKPTDIPSLSSLVTPTETSVPSPEFLTATPSPTPAPLTKEAIATCPVTFPNGSQPPEGITPGLSRAPQRHGNGALWADLGIGGKIIPYPELWREDGSLGWKMGWDRGVRGQLTVTGRRLDAPAPPAQGDYDLPGYGDLGFQAGSIRFPSEGCWEITGQVGQASLTFVTLLIRLPFKPLRGIDGWPEGLHLKDWDVSALPQSIRLIHGVSIWEGDKFTWGEGEISVETSQDIQATNEVYPKAVQYQGTIQGQPAICIQGAWDEQHRWQAMADAGILTWTAGDFRYRISHAGLGFRCADLLRNA